MKINTLRHGLRVWRETYKLSILFRVNEERAIRFRNRRLKLNAFRTWILSLKEQRKRFEDRVRVKSLYMAMSRWRRRVEASSLRRRMAFKVASSRVQNITRPLMYVVRFRTRKKIETHKKVKSNSFSKTEIGVRPEFINFSSDGIPVKVLSVSNTGRHKIVDTQSESGKIKIIAKSSDDIPSGSAFLNFKKEYTYAYGDDWIIE